MLPDHKIIIEVGLNETATKEQNPYIPYGIAEVIREGAECAQAGAAVLHFHARADDGTQVWNGADIYRSEMEGIAAQADVIMYPSYNRDYTAIWDLLDHPPAGAPMFMTPFDVFQNVGLVRWDPQQRSFFPVHFETMADAGTDWGTILERIVQRSQIPTVCGQELGDLRWTRHALEAGLIAGPVALKLFVIDQFVKGAEPSPAGVDALLSHVSEDMEPTIVPALMGSAERCEIILRHAIRRGAHIRVGLGDNPDAFPGMSNADLVRWAVELAADEGRKPASVEEVREFFSPARQVAASGRRSPA